MYNKSNIHTGRLVMIDQELETTLKLSYYKEIASLDKAHNICLVQHVETARSFVKKTLSMYNKDVYMQLKAHPVIGVPKIFEILEENNKLIVIEEYISGNTLEKILIEEGTISESTVRSYTLKLCDILTGLHSLNPPVIHRDIKPSNIIITDDDRLVLVDLNGAKQADSGQNKDTVLIGTSGYAAPEQYGFGASNVQTDLYAVGILMSCLITGNLGMIDQCPKGIRSIIKKCTQLDPQKRYSSAQQLKNALIKSGSKPIHNIIKYVIPVFVLIAVVIISVILLGNRSKDNKDEQASSSDTYAISNLPTAITDMPITPVDTIVPSDPPTPVIEVDTSSPTSEVEISPTISPSPSDIIPNDLSPVGVYEGNDKEKLVIASDGLAYYYCYSVEFTELQCPWTLKDNKLTITLSVMHCNITADTSNGYDELIFRSDSLNWNTEVFERTDLKVEDCILDPPPIMENYVFFMENGQKQVVIDNILFTIPKYYRPLMDNFPTTISFMDDDIHSYDAEGSFVSTISFILMSSLVWDVFAKDPLETTRVFMSSYMSTIQMGSSESVSIAGRDSFMVSFSGLYNEGYSKFANYINEGYLLIIPKKDGNGILFIHLTQAAGKWRDNDADFHKFVEFATELVGEE